MSVPMPTTDVERATVEMVPGVVAKLGETWDKTSTTYQRHMGQIEEYLTHYAAGENCPECNMWGRFWWGIAWGAGSCSCGWPVRLYHVIKDHGEDPTLICEATCNGHRVCTARRGDHLPEEKVWHREDGTSYVETALRCPDPETPPGLRLPFSSEYRPPTVTEFNGLLWVHPDYVGPKEESHE